MLNVDKQILWLECPECRFKNPVTIKQVRLRDAVICRGCKATVQLEDHMNTARKALRSIRRAFRELEEQIRRIGTIKIRL